MDLNAFVTKVSGDCASVLSVIRNCSADEIINNTSSVLSVSADTLKKMIVAGGCYESNLKNIINNEKHISWFATKLYDSVSQNALACWIRYLLVPYNKFMNMAISPYDDKSISSVNAEDKLNVKNAADIISNKKVIFSKTPDICISVNEVGDIWIISRLINAINNNYMYSLRHYSSADGWNTVLTAIVPESQSCKEKIIKEKKKIVTLHYGPGWTNTELTKDCGFIPYLMYKNHNCDSYMVGVKKDNYTYLDTYVKGMKMEFLETGSEEEKQEYIRNNASEIDGLLLRGPYPTNFEIARLYKENNPDGKIYLGLDANSHWMDRIRWDEPDFIQFMENCDVIATSCTAMQNHLNRKWPWKIEYIPNGYIKYNDNYSKPFFSEKNNVILTVSRLGTDQKATNVLLESFAVIADRIPEWTLRLVGSIEHDFEKYIDDYYCRYPELKSRVVFAGRISDKNQLTDEYRNAKIFALPSTFEGGTPNVVAEALAAGCAMAVTKFDAWEDAVDFGKCGGAAEINDVNGFAKVMLELCKDSKLEEKCGNAYLHAVHNFDMEKVVSRIYHMMFGGVDYEKNRIN